MCCYTKISNFADARQVLPPNQASRHDSSKSPSFFLLLLLLLDYAILYYRDIQYFAQIRHVLGRNDSKLFIIHYCCINGYVSIILFCFVFIWDIWKSSRYLINIVLLFLLLWILGFCDDDAEMKSKKKIKLNEDSNK